MSATRPKLLIADDHASMRGLIRRFCDGLDHDIVESADGLEAVACFASHEPDWVIMDVEMPIMDGFTATRVIRQSTPSARIIIATQHDSAAYRTAADAAGAFAFLSKEDLHLLPKLITQSTNTYPSRTESPRHPFL